MGWYPTVVDDSLEKNLKRRKKFWKDLQKHLVKILEEYNRKLAELGRDAFYKLKYKDRPYLPDSFEEFAVQDLERLKGQAFNPDHMEHIASWLWNKSIWPVFKKNKISGNFVLHHEDGGGYYSGIMFEDGIPYDIDVEVKVTKGEKMK